MPLVAQYNAVGSVEIHARKSVSSANTGNIFVGFSATPGANLRVIKPDASFTIDAPDGKRIDLRSIFIDAAEDGDGATWTAMS